MLLISRLRFERGSSVTLALGVAVLLVLAACTSVGKKEREWTEDVALDDGTVVTIERHVWFDESDSWSGDAYNATETQSLMSFRGPLSTLPTWSVPLVPLVLYRDPQSSDWVIVTSTSSCEVWRARGRPPTLYWEFRVRHGQWIEVPLAEGSFGRKTNLLMMYEDELPAKHISVAAKQLLQSDDRIAREYLEIWREHKPNCD